MRRYRFAAVVFCLLLPLQSAGAFDPRMTDILNLRLGMDVPAIGDRLHAQGIDEAAISRERSPEGAELTIHAVTLDGRLTIVTGLEGVRSIAYHIYRRGVGTPDMVRTAMIGRYGPPSSQTPLMWCERSLANGRCPADRPRLVFEQRAGGESVTTLINSPD